MKGEPTDRPIRRASLTVPTWPMLASYLNPLDEARLKLG
jgi:hypothetical protein